MTDELRPPMISFLASWISSSDICASRCLFSWSIAGSFHVLVTSFCCPFLAAAIPSLSLGCEKCGDAMLRPACLSDCLTSLSWFPFLCLNIEGPVLVLCAGKPVSELLDLGEAGGLASDEAARSLISPTRPTLKPGSCADLEEWAP